MCSTDLLILCKLAAAAAAAALLSGSTTDGKDENWSICDLVKCFTYHFMATMIVTVYAAEPSSRLTGHHSTSEPGSACGWQSM
jgi:hypothetical protein